MGASRGPDRSAVPTTPPVVTPQNILLENPPIPELEEAPPVQDQTKFIH
jgi:hypothetical protein